MTYLSVVYWKRCVWVHCYEDVSNVCLQHTDESTVSNTVLALDLMVSNTVTSKGHNHQKMDVTRI